jgi:hypothetical protein
MGGGPSVCGPVDPGLRTAPAIPAAELYTGVLFAALGLADVPWDGVLISSALWGVVRPGDRIPAYRLDMSAKPPGIGALAAYWREPLRAALPDRGLVLDLRSGSYAAAWQPRRATRLAVRGFTEAPDGRRTVITHMAKRVRGEVARLVLQSGGASSRGGRRDRGRGWPARGALRWSDRRHRVTRPGMWGVTRWPERPLQRRSVSSVFSIAHPRGGDPDAHTRNGHIHRRRRVELGV